jgi:mannitol/fructose-specific phosphotransferase system IIA component (Ntr-type)
MTHPLPLADILAPELVVPEMRASDRWEAIDELLEHLVNLGRVNAEHQGAIAALVKRREASMTTGIGFGFGLPHASTDLISEVTGAFGRSRKGIRFDALDNQPVGLVMLLLVPLGQTQRHLHTLAEIARLLHKPDLRQLLQAAPDGPGMYEVIRRFSVLK